MMGDYFLSFGKNAERVDSPESSMQFLPDLVIDRLDSTAFELVLTRTGCESLWSPFTAKDGTTIALAGRVALNPETWTRAEAISGRGGLACKAIYQKLQAEGFEGIQRINGAYAIHIFEPSKDRYSLILDSAGCYPSFQAIEQSRGVYSSHPDILAAAVNCASDWDLGSLATFLSIGQVPHPHSYYRSIQGLEYGTRYVADLGEPLPRLAIAEQFASREFDFSDTVTENDLACELADAVSRTAKQITQPRLGRTFIALSGGLDSRFIISHATPHRELRAFTIRGVRENREYRTARAIAGASGVSFTPLVRSFDHYADSAELGVRISGGMGSIRSNHFLGFRDQLAALGCSNMVTGCYFDYLFKTLAIDVKESRWLRREKLTNYSVSSYLPVFHPSSKYTPIVRDRLDELIPKDLAMLANENSRLKIAARRTFPVWREGDNIQRLIAMRVFDWYSPAILSDVLSVYWKTSIAARLNKSMYRRAVLEGLNPALLNIPDNNTGLPVDASPLLVTAFRYRVALRRRIERYSSQIDTQASWLNWYTYLRQSRRIRELWESASSDAQTLIEELSSFPYSRKLEPYLCVSADYFLRLLTLRLWVDRS